MAENSKIEWTDHTFNPWIGCTKVSPACKNCYAERDMDHRYGRVAWGPGGTRVLTGSENWAKPVRWDREAKEKGVRHRVFCASLADVFEDWQGPILNSKGERGVIDCNGGWWFTNGPVSNCYELTMDVVRQRLFALIDATPNLDWLLLTKRPENIRKMWLAQHLDGGTTGRIRELMDESESQDVHPYFRRNVWLGTSVENQEYADERIPELLKCRDLSPVLFLSCEPLLGPVDLTFIDSQGIVSCLTGTYEVPSAFCDQYEYDVKHGPKIDWVIAGGESGPEARPTDPEWFRSLRNQCQAAGVPFLFEQWGEFDENLQRVGKVRAGRSLEGVIHDGFPVRS
jgi:protein gp37